MEVGLYTFGGISADPHTGQRIGALERYRQVLQLAQLAEQAGLDVFGVGEHHRLDLPISSPAVVLAAIGATTRRLRLVSAVTILSTLDPVRVFQDYATADLCSEGRVEIIAGRGAYTESFPLFGYATDEYDALFAEHLELLLALNRSERVTWRGRFRAPLADAVVSPRPAGAELPIWLGFGGNDASAERAGRLGLPLTLANISRPPAQLAPQIARYREAAAVAGHAPLRTRVAVAGHLHLARDSQRARDRFYPHYSAYFRQHAPQAIYAADVPRDVYDQRAAPTGSLFVGSPSEIIDKVLYERELFGHDRFLAQIDLGALPWPTTLEVLQLLATEVAPALRQSV
jgi:alkanesulfonate monooxygenase SsuD/methylene tetrahydromethanopterin reductase-like flavin-dependent oxidoreductase (luciferase family)